MSPVPSRVNLFNRQTCPIGRNSLAMAQVWCYKGLQYVTAGLWGGASATSSATANNNRILMKRTRNTPILTAISLLFLGAWCATNALGDSPTLSEIPTIAGDGSNEGRAITYDGQYVAGLSGTGNGFLYAVGGAAATTIVSSDNAYALVANGVGYRTALDPIYATNRTELIISGMSSGFATEWMTADGGISYGPKRRNASDNYSTLMGTANQVGSSLSSDTYYVTHGNSNLKSILCVGQGIGQWLVTYNEYRKGTSADWGATLGISASGRAVGWRAVGATKTQTAKRNYMLTYPASPAFFNGLAGDNYGEPMSISADGNTVFGRSGIVTDTNTFYGYKTTFTSTPLTNNATTQGPVSALPEFSDTAGSVARSVPYGCTADGKYGVGMQYRGQERAVIWDTSNADPNIWTVLDLTDLARNNGFLGDFTLNLRRAYSAGTNGAGDIVVTGWGVNSGVAVRGFVMTVPKWIAAIGFPGNQTVNYQANVTISVKTNGTDSLSFQWYKNGTLLSGATSTSLTYNNVSCAGGEAGTYQLVVNNPSVSGVVTGAMTLTVLDPFISTQPLNRTNIEGTVATFTVSAGGAPTLSYQWQRDGANLSDGPTGNGSTIAGASTATLTISGVTLADGTNTPGSGSYTAVVTTSAGGCTATSRVATLMVVGRPVLSSIGTLPGGYYRLNMSGPFGQTYEVLYSTDVALPLSGWTPLTTNTFVGGDTFDDLPTDPQRFYILTSPYVITSP
jgi:hypothetical protein